MDWRARAEALEEIAQRYGEGALEKPESADDAWWLEDMIERVMREQAQARAEQAEEDQAQQEPETVWRER